MKYWLFKSSPSSYSLDDLRRDKNTCWEGVRNYQARNLLRDDIKKGDQVLFYHSNADPTGVAGVAKIVKEAYPDSTAWETKSKYFDERSSPEKPSWFMVDVAFVKKFKNVISLDQLKADTRLNGLMVTRRGSRLSIQPVEKKHFNIILKMAGSPE